MGKRFIVFFWVASLVGCKAVGPDFVRPDVDVPAQWDSDQISALEIKKIDESWWQGFNDPLLDELINYAIDQNLDLKQSILRVYEARAVLGDINSNRNPNTTLSSGAIITTQSEHTSPQPLDGDEIYDLGFDSSWELDFWGRKLRERESAAANYAALKMDHGNVLVSVTAEVARTYINIRIMEQRIVLLKESIEIQERALEIAEVWFKNGGRTELDFQQAKGLLFETSSQLPGLEQELYKLQSALALLLGTHRENIASKLSHQTQIPVHQGGVNAGIPHELLRRRPDVRSAEYLAKSQSAQVGISKAALYPSFSLSGSIGLGVTTGIVTLAGGSSGSSASDLFSSEAIQYSIGPGFRWDVFNFGRIKNRVRASDSRLQQSIALYQQVVLSAIKETNDALVSFEQSQQQEALLKQSMMAYSRASELSLQQYKDGAADYQSVLDSLRQLVNLKQSHIQSLGQISLNIIAIYKAIGGGWSANSNIKLDENTAKQMQERTDWGPYFDD